MSRGGAPSTIARIFARSAAPSEHRMSRAVPRGPANQQAAERRASRCGGDHGGGGDDGPPSIPPVTCAVPAEGILVDGSASTNVVARVSAHRERPLAVRDLAALRSFPERIAL
jgi:hypothetical protein